MHYLLYHINMRRISYINKPSTLIWCLNCVQYVALTGQSAAMLVHFISSSTSLKEMAPTKPIVKAKQDMPPKGGFPKINTIRGVRPRGPSGFAIWSFVIGCHFYGLYKMSFAAEKKRLHTVEKREARMAVGPVLQAEQDAVMHEKINRLLGEEYEIMKDRKEWEVEKTQRFR